VGAVKSPALYFRAGVGAVIANRSGRVLACERADEPGSWQFPQGGLKKNESPALAVLREVREETDIRKRDLELLDAYPQPLAYELPPEDWSAKRGRGQALYWFLFRLRDPKVSIDLEIAGEFRAWRWMRFEQLTRITPDFRRPAYRQIYERFGRLLS
jgi:putative (di)nucleoside polyphosphate hydrolase